MVCDTIIVAVIVTSSAVTLKVLGKLKGQMTDRTRYMQTQLNRLMSAEVRAAVNFFLILNFITITIKFAKRFQMIQQNLIKRKINSRVKIKKNDS